MIQTAAPGAVRRLYAGGAWLVLPAPGTGWLARRALRTLPRRGRLLENGHFSVGIGALEDLLPQRISCPISTQFPGIGA